MHFFTRFGGTFSRRRALALAAIAALPRPLAARAGHAGTCGANASPVELLMVSPVLPSDRPGLRVRLRVGLAGEGTPTVRGVVHIADGTAKTVLAVESARAVADCGDPDRDGRTGVTAIAFDARNPRTGARVPVSLTTADGDDIDGSGRYVVALRVGDFEERLDMTVRARRRRRKRRRRR